MADQPLTAIVEYQIRAENNSMDEWLEVWKPRGEDAQIGEPETLAYATAVNDEEPSQVLVYERYQRPESLPIHSAREAHKTLLSTMGERNMTRRRVFSGRFDDGDGFGWWVPSGEQADPICAGASISLLGLRFGEERSRQRFFELTREHARYCWDAEPSTWVYSCGFAAAAMDRELDVVEDDLLGVMICADRQAADQHANDPRHLGLGETMANENLDVKQLFLRTYTTTGHGFLWR